MQPQLSHKWSRRALGGALVVALLGTVGTVLFLLRPDVATNCGVRLDPSTPIAQGNLALAAVWRIAPDGRLEMPLDIADTPLQRLWRRWQRRGYPANLPETNAYIECAQEGGFQLFFRMSRPVKPDTLKISLFTSDGQRIRMGRGTPGGNERGIDLKLFADYPDATRWIDVRVDGKDGRVGTWRLTHLPRPVHHLPDGTPNQTHAAANGTRFAARAYFEPAQSDDNDNSLTVEIAGSAPPKARGKWFLALAAYKEWEYAGWKDTGRAEQISPYRQGDRIGYHRGVASLADRQIELRGQLLDYVQRDETVTLTGITAAPSGAGFAPAVMSDQAITTPRGLTARLERQGPGVQKPLKAIMTFSNYPPCTPGNLELIYRARTPRGSWPNETQGGGDEPTPVEIRKVYPPYMLGNRTGWAATEIRLATPAAKAGPLPPLKVTFRTILAERGYPFRLVLPIAPQEPYDDGLPLP